MAKLDEKFNSKDWEWIAVHFPRSKRETMAKVAWLICCKCTPEEISQRKIDPRIVIPLCAIVLLDEIDISNLKISTVNLIYDYTKFKRFEQKQEFIDSLTYSISSSERWQSLFKTLDIDLQFTLLYRLIAYRPATRDDWRDIFLDVELKFSKELYLSLLLILLTVLLFFGFYIGVFFLEGINNINLFVFHLKWCMWF